MGGCFILIKGHWVAIIKLNFLNHLNRKSFGQYIGSFKQQDYIVAVTNAIKIGNIYIIVTNTFSKFKAKILLFEFFKPYKH
jgi:hypothetical protein